jgi:hypothetical protein
MYIQSYPDDRRPVNFNIEILYWTKFGMSENGYV